MADFDDRYEDLFLLALRTARRIAPDRETATDVAAESLARAFARWRRIEPYADAWSTRAAINLALDAVRRKPARPTDPPPVAEPSLDRLVLASQLARLPNRQREAIVLRFLLAWTNSRRPCCWE